MASSASLCNLSSAPEFLAAHPEILVGRQKLTEAENNTGCDTFEIVNRPLNNLILIQSFNADTLERVYVVALVDDQKALNSYNAAADDDEDEDGDSRNGCATCGVGTGTGGRKRGPEDYLFPRMVTCADTCPEKQVGLMWPGK
ncbi:hypothetical protein LMH87_001601 [Akanthomyces muscarius]|uniref:Uncharacterized protein n=1 Tax=Akanthomyces muscarius TaxID=2231603 RepID=A0A9W8Q6S7_AKAMU|nr:hypothetical protein LMH87_001601 [Akanthomyces muscarius]KAJ4147048.1 hypothetical protein LMH87_001601 [Akanthomyces muscarius]